MTVAVRRVASKRDLDTFIAVPDELNRGDPNWVTPLRMEARKQQSPAKNPFFEHADVERFIAWRDGRAVGRITAQVDHRHNQAHGEKTGMFGFFDAIDDAAVAQALVDTAHHWVKDRGMERLQGPYSWSMHEQVGVLVDGFDTPPALLMNHNPAYYDGLLKGAGLRKAKDLFAYHFIAGTLPQEADEMVQLLTGPDSPVQIRSIDMKHFEAELRIVFDIYNEAWRDNWGFVPITADEITTIAKDLKPIVDPRLALIAEVDGRPAGMAIAVPNVNEAIRDLGGRLTPVRLAKLLWRLKVRGLRSARLMLVGIKDEFRGPHSQAMLLGLYGMLNQNGVGMGIEWGELSWTLEDNEAINGSIAKTGARHYKTYRLYSAKV